MFYVPIPPSYNLDIDLNTRTMSLVADPYKDLKILLNDGKGHIKSMTTKKGVDILVERNKIYNITFKDNTPPTTGTAKAKINGVDVDVNWVQLWAGGPKFAEYNIGTTEEKAEGNLITFYDAIKTDNDYAWGANWRTPSKDEMDELNLAAREDSKKITCKYEEVNNIWGFTFTGTEAGYTDNHVFFPGDITTLWHIVIHSIGNNHLLRGITGTTTYLKHYLIFNRNPGTCIQTLAIALHTIHPILLTSDILRITDK